MTVFYIEGVGTDEKGTSLIETPFLTPWKQNK